MKPTAYKRIDQIRIGVVAVILLVSGIMFMVLPLLALRWTQTPYPGLLFDPHLVVNKSVAQFEPLTTVEPAIAYPDRVVMVDGRTFSDNRSLHEYLATHQPGDILTFTFDQPPPDSAIDRTTPETERTIDLVLSIMDETTFGTNSGCFIWWDSSFCCLARSPFWPGRKRRRRKSLPFLPSA